MIKIEVFFNSDANKFEEEINKFIENRKIVDIKFTTDFSVSGYYNAMIIYEE